MNRKEQREIIFAQAVIHGGSKRPRLFAKMANRKRNKSAKRARRLNRG